MRKVVMVSHLRFDPEERWDNGRETKINAQDIDNVLDLQDAVKKAHYWHSSIWGARVNDKKGNSLPGTKPDAVFFYEDGCLEEMYWIKEVS